ncbi:hypothetical protein GGR88_002804 [Sphingomonas jejuensis]|uniref:Uncharacterized protein n=1 Tax=Sphingomonas jejuensis TaxID=904715 RepID=A0ABX0XPS0_9SPHN|nr:hypothetical protein [Sphingomonas jejuensis]NJC35290.1 hypothetical protein [Sphingomonas jejuensis]
MKWAILLLALVGAANPNNNPAFGNDGAKPIRLSGGALRRAVEGYNLWPIEMQQGQGAEPLH